MDKRFANLDTAADKDGWKILGPGGGGCVHLMAVNPLRPQTLLVSCDMTAGYISQDGGQSWREFNLKSRLWSFAFDQLDPEVIYAGSSGLFRSADGGRTWRMLFPDPASVTGETRSGDEARHAFVSGDNWPGGSIHAIQVDPQHPDSIYIVIKNNALELFFSTDGGRHWEKRAGLEGDEIHCLAFAPAREGAGRALYAFTDQAVLGAPPGETPRKAALPAAILTIRHASSGVNPLTGETIFYLSALARGEDEQIESGVWKSTDCGSTWHRSAAGAGPGAPAGPALFSQVSACARDARRVYLIAEKYPELDERAQAVERYGILASCDAGETWAWAVKMDDDCDPPNRSGGWAERDYGAAWGDIKGEEQISPKGRFAWDVAASPVDPDVCYTMDFSTIFKTADGGSTWEQLVTQLHPDGSVSSRGIDVLSAYGVFFDPFDPHHIALALTDVGVFHSRNGGRTWLHALNGVPRPWVNTCYWLVFDPDVPGRAWSAWAGMHDLPRLKMFKEEFFQKYQGGICRTDDGLGTWQPSSQGLAELAPVTHLVLDPASPPGRRTLYAAVFNCGVYCSRDDGHSWAPGNGGLDPANLMAWRLALLPDGTLYLITARNSLPGRETPGALYRSRDGAGSWDKVSLPEGVIFPTDIIGDPAEPWRLYLCAWPQSAAGGQASGGLYTTTDGGKTWANLFDPAAHIYSAAVDPHNPAVVYLGSFDTDLYRSADRGQTWEKLSGFDFQWGHRPFPDPRRPGMLYMTTFGSSIWYGPGE